MSGQWENVATMLNWISAVVTIQSVFANPVTYTVIMYSNMLYAAWKHACACTYVLHTPYKSVQDTYVKGHAGKYFNQAE